MLDWIGVRTEYRRVELGEGDVGEEREASTGEEAEAELLGLDLAGEAPRQPPLAGPSTPSTTSQREQMRGSKQKIESVCVLCSVSPW
jgi:hypothetical protein